MSKPTMTEYREHLKGKTCKWCRINNDGEVPLQDAVAKHYEHPGGYPLEGFARPRWIYVLCPKCVYQWSFRKLGVPHPEETEKV